MGEGSKNKHDDDINLHSGLTFQNARTGRNNNHTRWLSNDVLFCLLIGIQNGKELSNRTNGLESIGVLVYN